MEQIAPFWVYIACQLLDGADCNPTFPFCNRVPHVASGVPFALTLFCTQYIMKCILAMTWH